MADDIEAEMQRRAHIRIDHGTSPAHRDVTTGSVMIRESRRGKDGTEHVRIGTYSIEELRDLGEIANQAATEWSVF
ncbi:MAG: hypothetical protein OXC29_25540 [Rhodococcus sp.]|nr:hypothetical protein [Rhodococcus sp. (in: high G+C Gram-positive bacteria)]